jgi:dienelactone hydrolase
MASYMTFCKGSNCRLKLECWIISSWDSEIPVLALFGAIDNMAPFSDCEGLIKNLGKPHNFTYRVYDDAHHLFDNPDLPPELKRYYGTVGYNEAAAKSSWLEVTNFLRK